MEENMKEKIIAIKECLVDYVCPIFICGKIFDLNADSLTIINATMPKEELIIRNQKYPEWVERIKKNATTKNVLLIKDFDKISLEEQHLFIDIICKKRVSGEEMPKNLKIIVNAENRCPIIEQIREEIQYFEI